MSNLDAFSVPNSQEPAEFPAVHEKLRKTELALTKATDALKKIGVFYHALPADVVARDCLKEIQEIMGVKVA